MAKEKRNCRKKWKP